MKLVSLIIANLLVAAVAQAKVPASPVPQCYGNPEVSQFEPFLLVLEDVDADQASLVAAELMEINSTITVSRISSFESVQVLVIAVDAGATPADTVNRRVYRQVLATAKKYGIPAEKVILECNGRVWPSPRAGGMTGSGN